MAEDNSGKTADPRADGELRSRIWFRPHDKYGVLQRSWMQSQGFPPHLFDGRPVIGICNTFSELNPCNAHLRELAEHVKRGVYEAGGFPVEFPVLSMGEPLMRPTTMLYRNLASVDVEETIRANPIDGVVLLAGCDKTTPAVLMGAASCDLPSILVSGGPMLNGRQGEQHLASGTDAIRLSEEVRAGRISLEAFLASESGMARSNGSCNTMGTASTMASMSEALGVTLPGNAAIPAVDSRRRVLAHLSGRRAVEMVREGLTLSRILTRQAFENAIRVNGAIGGSTNAVVHLLALAGRIGVELTLEDWDRLGCDMPCLVNLKPSGQHLMEEFYYAGGLPALMREIADRLHLDAVTANGRTLGENIADAECHDRDVIRTRDNAIMQDAGIAVLRGNLCPGGAIIKPSAASPALMRHTGRAVVFESVEEMLARKDDPDLDVDENCVLVLKGAGPRGYPGMAEVGNMPIPQKVLEKGITDMVRISDGRMSGTAYGTVILHVAPESAVGGPLALVRSGDMIELDVPARRLVLHVPEAELAERRSAWVAPEPPEDHSRGWARMYIDHVMQADRGVDLDFLVGRSRVVPRRVPH